MDSKEIKKLLAGVGIAGLLSGAGVILTSGTAAARGSGCGGAKAGAGGMMKMDPSAAAMPGQMEGAADMGKDAASAMDGASGVEMNADQAKDAATEQVKEKVREKVQEKVQEQTQQALPDK